MVFVNRPKIDTCYTVQGMTYSPSRLYSLEVHEDAEDDLDDLYEKDEDAAADIDVFLQEVKGSQEMMDNLTRNGYVHHGEGASFNVAEWQKTKLSKYNLWRVRLLYLAGASNYRIVYAFHAGEYRYYVLAVLHRDFNYDPNHERTKRILALYDSLDIPRY